MIDVGALVSWWDEKARCARVGRVTRVVEKGYLVAGSLGSRLVPVGEARLLRDGPRRKDGQTALELQA